MKKFSFLHISLFYSSDTAVQFQDFVYLSQVVQAVCIKAEAEHYRRYISVDDVFTRGTLYWQLVRSLMHVYIHVHVRLLYKYDIYIHTSTLAYS